jgi:hypothetical protein
MATSPSFNWPEPDNTDLVKNGALAIRTAVDAIDTSMTDLRGGTTGQVLSKASNTDMDFSWVAQDDSNAIQNAIVDAKGDLIAASANDTPARLAVGANNTLLTADSTAATGLKWAGAWTTWTPTIANLTVGNGVLAARYARIANTVTFSLRVDFGSTTTVSGSPNFTLPITAFSTAACLVNIVDAGVTNYYGEGGIYTFDLTKCYMNAFNSAGTYVTNASWSATTPFTWGTGDYFTISGTYEVA